MSKKILSVLLCVMFIFSIAACGNKDDKTSEKTSETTAATTTKSTETTTTAATTEIAAVSTEDMTVADNSTSGPSGGGNFDKILQEIEDDFNSVISDAEKKLNNVYSTIGDTYDGYVKNESVLEAWYNELYQESEKLFQRTIDKNIEYYKLIAKSPDKGEYKYTHPLLDDLYDKIYNDAFDTYYNNIYDGIFDDVYNKYYDGIISDAYDSIESYKEWSNTRSGCYKKWSNARTEIYRLWSKKRTLVYKMRSNISSNFLYKDNFDVDAIVNDVIMNEAVASNSKDEDNIETSETTTSAETASTTAKTKVDPVVGTLYIVGKDIEAGKYLFECLSSDYGMNFICFKSDKEYNDFVNAERFTNGEFSAAVEQNAHYDLYLYQGDVAYVGLSKGNIVLIDGGSGNFKKLDSIDNSKIYPGVYFVGSDLSEGSYTFTYDDAKYGSVTVVTFANLDQYYKYHKSSRFTFGDEDNAISNNSETATYLYNNSSQIINLKSSGVLLIKGGTVSIK